MEQDITITAKAAEQVTKIMAENSIPAEHYLRIGIKGGGCSGFSYTLGFDSEKKEVDSVISLNGVNIVVDAKSLFYLSGTELDYSDGLNGKGFTFSNPNAAKTCGCGNSFGV